MKLDKDHYKIQKGRKGGEERKKITKNLAKRRVDITEQKVAIK